MKKIIYPEKITQSERETLDFIVNAVFTKSQIDLSIMDYNGNTINYNAIQNYCPHTETYFTEIKKNELNYCIIEFSLKNGFIPHFYKQ
jgi:hypothetical protein